MLEQNPQYKQKSWPIYMNDKFKMCVFYVYIK
jgi:hypothetical protein